jgi:virulence factor Mce-like protein
MIRGNVDPVRRRRGNQLIALGMVAALFAGCYAAFHPALPFTHRYRIEAVVRSSNQLQTGSPVRIAGVDVGRVADISAGPGNTTRLTLDIDSRARPLHRDATLRIRTRVFLEGGFYAELSPGSPSAPELPSGGTIPLPQTATPVQLHQLLTAFDDSTRDSLRTGLHELARGVRDGGGEDLRRVAPQLAPAFRNIAWVTQAVQGTEADDVSGLVSGASRASAALAREQSALGDLVTNMRVTADALASGDDDLGDTIAEADRLLRAAPPTLRALDRALPVVARFSRGVRPALPAAPASLRRTAAAVAELGTLVAPAVRGRTIRALTTTFRDLPELVQRLASTFPTAKPLADCLRTRVIPVLSQTVPDGEHTSGRPAWQDFAHSVVGLTSATQNFDGNGYSTRYLFGGNGNLLSGTQGAARLVGQAASLRSRPAPPKETPPLRGDLPCTSQPVPTLEAPTGGGG